MARPSASGDHVGGFALLMLCLTTVSLLLGIALAVSASAEVAQASPFGRAGSVIVAGVAAVVACIGSYIAWRGAGAGSRTVIGGLSFTATALIGLMALFFVFSGGPTIVFTMLAVCAALFIALIGRAVLKAPATGKVH